MIIFAFGGNKPAPELFQPGFIRAPESKKPKRIVRIVFSDKISVAAKQGYPPHQSALDGYPAGLASATGQNE